MSLDDATENFSPRKLGGIAFVALLHVAIIYALINGLGTQAVQILAHPLEVKIIQQIKPPVVAPPPPPPPLVAPPLPFIPQPLIQIAQPPPVPVIATVTRTKPVAPPPPPQPAPASVRSGAMLNPNQSCAPPQYPQDAEDMEQTGISVLQFLIDTNGNVVQSRIASSSGHASLDSAAEEALGQCKFRPAIGADGKPQAAWTSIRYVWQLN
jgi:periplasmic protein TonB